MTPPPPDDTTKALQTLSRLRASLAKSRACLKQLPADSPQRTGLKTLVRMLRTSIDSVEQAHGLDTKTVVGN
jgi:hypothetical protein